MIIYEWAQAHNIPLAAVHDLLRRFGAIEEDAMPAQLPGSSEEAVQAQARLQLGRDGGRAWRNNVGALKDKTGRMVRYGLANDSKRLNDVLKSSDLIGIKPVVVTPAHVGTVIGQFWARECKSMGWRYSDTDHERAQLAFIQLINSLGGDAAFANGGV